VEHKIKLCRRRFGRIAFSVLLGLTVTAVTAKSDDALLQGLPDIASPSTPASATDVRGVLKARDQAVLSSELNARVLEMPFRESESFHKGNLLVRFDCSAYQAQLAASQAAARAAQQELAQNQQLAAMKSVGRHAVALSEAHLAQAQAESQVYQIQAGRCNIVAPFDGRIVSRKVQVYESASQGMPLLEIVDNRHLEIHLLVPSRWLHSLKPGQKFVFTPDETNRPLQAEVVRLGARIDEGSQTLGLIGKVVTPDDSLLAGMSGSARFTEAP
jgi:membrane fusion protein, multidrug efflux system